MWSEQKAKARTWVLAKVCWDARDGVGAVKQGSNMACLMPSASF